MCVDRGQSIIDQGAKAILSILSALSKLGEKVSRRNVDKVLLCVNFEHPREYASIPPHKTDYRAFLLTENIGSRSLIYLKDEKDQLPQGTPDYRRPPSSRGLLRRPAE
jgi:hypothetical protein